MCICCSVFFVPQFFHKGPFFQETRDFSRFQKISRRVPANPFSEKTPFAMTWVFHSQNVLRMEEALKNRSLQCGFGHDTPKCRFAICRGFWSGFLLLVFPRKAAQENPQKNPRKSHRKVSSDKIPQKVYVLKVYVPFSLARFGDYCVWEPHRFRRRARGDLRVLRECLTGEKGKKSREK